MASLTLRTLTDPAHNTKGSELSWQEMDQNLLDLYSLLSAGLPTGMTMDFAGASTAVPSGWTILDGKTIGSPSSGADYANSNAEDLFNLIWNSTFNSSYQLLDSSGNAVSRQSNSQSDWNSNRRIPLPDVRGKSTVGSGTASDTDAGGNQIDYRQHLIVYGYQELDISHDHNISLSTDSVSSQVATTTASGSHTPSGSIVVQSAGSHYHSISATTNANGGHTPDGDVEPGKAYPDGSTNILDHATAQIPEATSETSITVVVDPTHTRASRNDNPEHAHGFTGDPVPDHTHTFSTTTEPAGGHTHNATFTGDSVSDHTHDVTIPSHSHSVSGSTNQSLSNYDNSHPSIAMHKIIKL